MATPIQEAEKLISSGNTEKALQLLVKRTSGRFKRKFALLLNRLKGIEKRFHQGTLSEDNYQTEKNKISADLLFTIQQYEAHLNGESVGTSQSAILLVMSAVIGFVVTFLGIRYYLQEPDRNPEIECTGKEQVVYIAKSELLDAPSSDANVLFSKKLKLKIDKGISSNYLVRGLAREYDYTNREAIESMFTNDSCVYKGIFVNANYFPSEKICDVYIDIVNLELEIPQLKDENRVILDNPPNVQFEINSDADLIASFVLAIASLYEGSMAKSLSLFSQIEQVVDLDKQPELQAFVKMSKGNAYLLSGDRINALKEYESVNGYSGLKSTNLDVINDLPIYGGVLYPFKTMKDGKKWLTKNLDIKVGSSWCYDNDPKNCEKYGRLYTWEVANKACAQLGDGWRLPTDKEWTKMVDQYGGEGREAYQALIEGGSTGFAALLGGWRYSVGSYDYLGAYGDYWTHTEDDSLVAWSYHFIGGKLWRDSGYRTNGRSVRCLQD